MGRDSSTIIVCFLMIAALGVIHAVASNRTAPAQPPDWVGLAERLPDLRHASLRQTKSAVGGDYRPTTQIESLIEKMNLTEAGRDLFLAAKPQVVSEIDCGIPEAIGCFKWQTGDTRASITLLSGLGEPELILIASHELLHAVWENDLTASERAKLKPHLDKAYKRHKSYLDSRLKPYGQMTESGRYHELHSYIGTEIDSLPTELENHYGRYFNGRGEIIDPWLEPTKTASPVRLIRSDTPTVGPRVFAPRNFYNNDSPPHYNSPSGDWLGPRVFGPRQL